jgi:hypothetical protein
MIKALFGLSFAFALCYWIYKLLDAKREPDENLRLAELREEIYLYPFNTELKRLNALYESRGRILYQLRDLIPEEKRRQFIQDRIILAREIARLTIEEADIVSDFEIIQQPFIQQP